MTTPEQDLWVAVIAQNFTDGTRDLPKKTKKYVPWLNDYKNARVWLESYSQDFKQVCFLAGVDPSWVKREWDEIKQGNKQRSKWIKNR
tara:strand:+ start:282 stop:545 length:264 start_codon:yes stop_codon:yes gene_type:complete